MFKQISAVIKLIRVLKTGKGDKNMSANKIEIKGEDPTSKAIKGVADTLSIVFPAILAVLGTFKLSNLLELTENIYALLAIILGAVASIGGIVYNMVHKGEHLIAEGEAK